MLLSQLKPVSATDKPTKQAIEDWHYWVLRGQLGLAAHFHPTGDRRRASRRGAFLNQRPFQFRQDSHHLPHRPARGRGGVEGFRQRAEGHPPRFQIVQEADQVPQRPAQPIQLPHRQRVAFLESLEAFRQFRPLSVRPSGPVGEESLAPRPLQGGPLYIRALVRRGDPRIADVHGPILSLISDTAKSLIDQGRKVVSKLLSSDRCVRL